MLNNAAAFVAALKANEDDEATRLIYADWLEEQGDYEEAERQRKWTSAKTWLLSRLEESRMEPDDEHAFNPSFDELIASAREALEQMYRDAEADVGSDLAFIYCFNNTTLTETLRKNAQVFWEHWAIVTGVRVPPDLNERISFTCGC